MVLIRYWRIVVRRLWLIVVLVALVGILYVLTYRTPQPVYTASMRYAVGITPERSTGEYYTYDRYYTWLTAEYLIDDLSEVVKSSAFSQDVAQAAGLNVPPGVIQGSTTAGKLHRILSVSVSWPDHDQLEKIANAVTQVLQERNSAYFGQLGTDNAVITPIDPPAFGVSGRSLRDKLDLPLRLIIAVVTGVLLVFLLDYLDASIRGRDDAEAVGITLLGEIPRNKGSFSPFPRRRLP